MKYILIASLSLFLTGAAFGNGTLEDCINEHRLCTSDCLQKEGTDSQAACVAQCAGTEAQCAGRIGIETSEPFIRKKAKELEGLLEEFFGDILPEVPQERPVEKPSPQTKDL